MNTRLGSRTPARRLLVGIAAAVAAVTVLGLTAGPAAAGVRPPHPYGTTSAKPGSGRDITRRVIAAAAAQRRWFGGRGGVPQVAVGGDPQMAVLDPSTLTLYVDNSNDNTVSIIDAARCNATTTSGCDDPAPTVTIPDGAGAMAIDQATHTLYVTGGLLSMVDAATCNAQHLAGCNQTPSTAPIGNLALSLGVNQTTGTVYIGNAGDNTVSVINAATCNAHTAAGCTLQRTLQVGNFPGIGAIDEHTDTIYVNNNGANQQGQNDTISIVNGATCNAHVASGCGQTPPQAPIGFGDINASVGVTLAAATHTLYITNGGDNTVSMLNTATCNATHAGGCAHTSPTVAVSRSPQGIGLDPVLHTVYVASGADNTLSVIDAATCNATDTSGCTQHLGAVRTGRAPIFVAPDTATHTMYTVDIDGRDVSVVNAATCNATQWWGCTWFPPTFAVGGNPEVVAVNSKTHTAYVANSNDNTVSVVNTATCDNNIRTDCAQKATVPVGSAPGPLAVNQATNTVYVSNDGGDNTISVINGATCNAAHTTGCSQSQPVISDPNGPIRLAVNQATHTIYVSNADGTISVINGATCNGTVTTGCATIPPTVTASTTFVFDVAVNPVTNTLYTANFQDGTVSMIDGRTCNAMDTSGCGQTPTVITLSAPGTLNPIGLDVDQRTNTVYVGNFGGDIPNTISMINGARCDATTTAGCGQVPATFTAGLGPFDFAINQARDTVYVVNLFADSVTVIDAHSCNAHHPTGCQHTFPAVQVGGSSQAIDLDTATCTVYVANGNDNNVSVFGPRR